MRWNEAVKPAPEQVTHGSPVGVEDSLPTPASDTGPHDSKLRFVATLRQAGPRTRRLLFWLRLITGVGVLGLIFTRVDLSAATIQRGPLLLEAIAGATGLLMLSQAVAALRWGIILDDDRLPWFYLMRLSLIGAFFGLFLPTSVGGDAVRAIATARSSPHSGRAIASVFIDRGFGVLATLVLAVIGFTLDPSLGILTGNGVRWEPRLVSIGLPLALASTAVLLLSRSARARSVVYKGLGMFTELARSPRRMVKVLGLALLSQSLIVLLWYTLSRGMNLALPGSMFLWAVPLVSLSALLPVTFAGLGVREGVWLVLLAGTAIPPANIVAFSLLYFGCSVLVGIIGGIWFVFSGIALDPSDRITA